MIIKELGHQGANYMCNRESVNHICYKKILKTLNYLLLT